MKNIGGLETWPVKKLGNELIKEKNLWKKRINVGYSTHTNQHYRPTRWSSALAYSVFYRSKFQSFERRVNHNIFK